VIAADRTPAEPAAPAASGPGVTLRRALASDSEAIWGWNFAPDVRARSRSSAVVTLAEHTRWLARRLDDDASPIWVIEQHGAPVGVVRLDDGAGARARISIALASGARGHGVGRSAISNVCRSWRRPIVAEILTDNAGSRACFEACGFHLVAVRDGVAIYHWEPESP